MQYKTSGGGLPLVSVLMPVFNAAPYLAATIDAVLQQTYQNIELIVVDDGSTDKSFSIARSYKDPRIKCILQTNRGQSSASNAALSHAKGAYLKFVDADDILSPQHIEAQVIAIENQTDVLVTCRWGRFYTANPDDAVFENRDSWGIKEPIKWLLHELKVPGHDMLSAWQWLIPRQLIEAAGGWNEGLSLNNDFEFSIRLVLAATQIRFADNAKLHYRSGMPQSLSRSMSREAVEAALATTDLGCQLLCTADNSPEMRQICADRYQVWIYRFYPLYPDLYKKFCRRVKEYGGSKAKMEGGFILRILRAVFGWRMAKKIKSALGRY